MKEVTRMSEVKNVLVFPAGTEIALEIHDALKFSKFVRLFGATSVPCHAEFVYAVCEENVPNADDPALIDALNAIIDKYSIDYVYPAHDSALLSLARAQARLHAPVVSSPLETVEICRSKNKTYEFLKGAPYRRSGRGRRAADRRYAPSCRGALRRRGVRHL